MSPSNLERCEMSWKRWKEWCLCLWGRLNTFSFLRWRVVWIVSVCLRSSTLCSSRPTHVKKGCLLYWGTSTTKLIFHKHTQGKGKQLVHGWVRLSPSLSLSLGMTVKRGRGRREGGNACQCEHVFNPVVLRNLSSSTFSSPLTPSFSFPIVPDQMMLVLWKWYWITWRNR